MRTKVTLVLIFLNVALFFFIFYFERPRLSEASRDQARRLVLGALAANIQTLEIAGATETVKLERRPSGWYLTSPLEWPAAENAVRRILNELELLEREASFTKAELERNGMTLADYGLEKPALTLTFTPGNSGAASNGEATPVVLRVGSETGGGNRLYILSPDGERVLVVNRSLAESLRLSLDQLRADSLFSIPLVEISSLSLQAAAANNVRVRIRREGNRWSFEGPIRARADKTKTEIAINHLNSLVASSFPATQAADTARTGLSSPAFRITLEGINRRETLFVGNPVPSDARPNPAPPDGDAFYYAKLDERPAVFITAIPQRLLTDLRNAQVELREKRILDLEGRTPTAVTLRAPGQPELTLQLLEKAGSGPDTGTWQIVRRDQTTGNITTLPADATAVNRLLQQLAFLDAKEFLSDAPSAADLENWGFTRPQREISITLSDPAAIARTGTPGNQIVLQLGLASEKQGLIYARLDKQDYVYLIDPGILRETPVVARMFREKLLRELPAGALITGLSLKKLDGTVIYERNLAEKETWTTALAGETETKRTALEALLQQLRVLRAKTIVADHYSPTVSLDGEEQPWTYQLDTTLAFISGAGATTETSNLFLSERTGGGTQLAGSSDFGGVIFEVEQPMLDALWVLTYGPRDLGAPSPDNVPKPPAP